MRYLLDGSRHCQAKTSVDFSLKEVLKVKVFDDKEMTWGLRSKSGAMRGLQQGITLGGRTSGSFNLLGLQNKVAKNFAKFLHLSWDLSQGS